MPIIANANATIAINSAHNDSWGWAKAKVPGKKAAENDYD